MTHWLFPANIKFYDVFSAFSEKETYWPMNARVSIGDVVYIYLAAPHKQLGFVCSVKGVDYALNGILQDIRPFLKSTTDNKKPSKSFMKLQTTSVIEPDKASLLSYKYLKEHGLNGMLMGPRKPGKL